jgi:hypothetical protein
MKVQQAKLFANFSASPRGRRGGFFCRLDLVERARIMDLLGRLRASPRKPQRSFCSTKAAAMWKTG